MEETNHVKKSRIELGKKPHASRELASPAMEV